MCVMSKANDHIFIHTEMYFCYNQVNIHSSIACQSIKAQFGAMYKSYSESQRKPKKTYIFFGTYNDVSKLVKTVYDSSQTASWCRRVAYKVCHDKGRCRLVPLKSAIQIPSDFTHK